MTRGDLKASSWLPYMHSNNNPWKETSQMGKAEPLALDTELLET